MKKLKLRSKELRRIGFDDDALISITISIVLKNFKRYQKEKVLIKLEELIKNPDKFKHLPIYGNIVNAIQPKIKTKAQKIQLQQEIKPYNIFGSKEIEDSAIHQMNVAMQLPVSTHGALMPDAHEGYGLPIGGVLATRNVVIPYGVGMDIGCRMCMSVYDLPVERTLNSKEKIKKILEENTRFGRGTFSIPDDHEVMQNEAFSSIKFIRSLKDKAFEQLGTSGFGNHFVDVGYIEIKTANRYNLSPGKYFAILSHSGSRGMGADIAKHYTKIAMSLCDLPKGAKQLAWLDLRREEGQEYWQAMSLAGKYAEANHEIIHKNLSKAFAEKPLAIIENHHNFAWKETFPDGNEVIIHRKGATPAHVDDYGIIPGSMTTPAYLVKGKGDINSLFSASHGAGRKMSRSKAKKTFTGNDLQVALEKSGVSLMGGGLDEVPMAYKDINKVMYYQKNFVEVIGIFQPKIVRMDKSR
jgi:tRNA-splicing ligase RtcB (3'-phosphate/5'-hydroxy nucleic acid ligase)